MYRLIYGITDLADVLFYNLNYEGVKIDGFCVNKQFIAEDSHLGVSVFSFEDIESIYSKDEIGFYICIGYSSMNDGRTRIYNALKEKEISILSYKHPSALVMSNDIGEGNLFFEHSVVGAYARLGNCNILYPKSMLSHHSIAGDFNFFAISSTVAGNVRIGNNCFFGNNSSTKDGISIADYTLAGAGSYVWKDTEAYDCIVPAKGSILSKYKSKELL